MINFFGHGPPFISKYSVARTSLYVTRVPRGVVVIVVFSI